jgi:GntR family transcriptional regulator, transcriptional repressor for pyruvate dehydrogenase complex
MALEIKSFQSLKRSNVVEDIIETFKQAIIQGDLRPGQRLPSEGELVQQFGVGRGTLREAMKKLEALGVVNIQRGDGTYIVDKPSSALLDPLEFALMLEARMGMDLIELRSLIEVGYFQLAAQKATEEDWMRIEAAQEAYAAYASSEGRDVDAHTRLDLNYHFSVIDATHNPLVISVAQTVEKIFFASIRRTLTKAAGWEYGIEAHRSVVQAMRGGDPEGIRRAVVESLSYWAKEVEDISDLEEPG